MLGKKIRVEILLGAALLLISSGSVGMFIRPALEPDMTLVARYGDVVWNHEQHARMKEIANCNVCHHTAQQGDMRPRPCRDCHKHSSNLETLVTPELFMKVEEKKYSGENGPPAMVAFHAKCMGCHKAMHKGPVACRDCHEQRFSGPHGIVMWDHRTHARKMDMNQDCVFCHHKDENAKNDGDYRPCSACHKPANTIGIEISTGIANHKDAKHGQCQSCHSEYNPEDDLVSCDECHKGMEWEGQGKEEKRPCLEQALHKKCSECHNKYSPKLEKSMPAYCSDCHKTDPSWIDEPGMQPILWDHFRHGKYSEDKCETCHHTAGPHAPHMACRSCHGTGLFETPPLEKVFKKSCLECHKEKNVGLTTWESFHAENARADYFKYEGKEGVFWWNHRFHAVGLSFSCRNCHHNTIKKDGQYVTAAKAGVVWQESNGRIQSCKNCHGQDGPTPGSVAQGTKAPAFDKAFRKVCLECHQRLQGGPQTWDEFFRTEPLKREQESKK